MKEIRSLFVETTAQALSTTSKIVSRYRDTPRTATFSVDAKDGVSYWTGDVVRISHSLDVVEFGQKNVAQWTIVSAEETEPGHRVSYVCEDTTLFGKITAIVADGTSDYQGDGSDPFTAAFIGDASGLLSDGSNSARTA